MNRDAQSLTRNNQAKSCKLPVSRTHKIGSQGAHTIQTKLLKNSATPIIITGDSTAAGLRRYGHVWLNYFRDALNSGVNGDRFENVLWWARDISFPRTTSFAIIHCGTNNMEKYQPKDIAVAIIKITKAFKK